MNPFLQLLLATSFITIPILSLLLIWRGVIWADKKRAQDLAKRKAKVLNYKLSNRIKLD